MRLPGNKADLYMQNLQITSHHSRQLREVFYSSKMHQYLKDKHNWEDRTLGIVWWEIHGKSFSKITPSQARIIQKFIHNRLPCNKREHTYYGYRSPLCNMCKDNIECNDHVIKCNQCRTRVTLRQEFIKT
jgi:hypothetical protein